MGSNRITNGVADNSLRDLWTFEAGIWGGWRWGKEFGGIIYSIEPILQSCHFLTEELISEPLCLCSHWLLETITDPHGWWGGGFGSCGNTTLSCMVWLGCLQSCFGLLWGAPVRTVGMSIFLSVSENLPLETWGWPWQQSTCFYSFAEQKKIPTAGGCVLDFCVSVLG